MNIARGAIHAFAPDGGAQGIAGLNMGDEAATILALFACIGLMHLTLGGFRLWAVLRRPDLVLVLLAFQTVQAMLGASHLWFWRRLPVAVPGAMFNLVLISVPLLTWGFTVTSKRKTP